MRQPDAIDTIDRYLADLRRALAAPFPPRLAGRRRLLAEAEAHLREAAAREQATGRDATSAQRRAIERFGSPAEVVAAARASGPRLAGAPLVALVAALAFGAAVATGAGTARGDHRVPPRASPCKLPAHPTTGRARAARAVTLPRPRCAARPPTDSTPATRP